MWLILLRYCMYEPSHLYSLLNTPWASFWICPEFFFFFFLQLMFGKLALHEDIRHGVRQPESNQASSDEHRWGQEDGDSLRDANKRPKNQVPQHCRQLTQSVAETKACSSGDRKIKRRWKVRREKNMFKLTESPLCLNVHVCPLYP